MTIAFWSMLEHHSLALRPIFNKMSAQGKDVVDLFNHPAGELLSHSCIVSGTAEYLPASKLQNTVYHFHSLGPNHTRPGECDHKFFPVFKGVMLPGEWWVGKWVKEPKCWAVIGWPKNDLLRPSTKHKRTVLYSPSMFDFERMRTLDLVLNLSAKMGFKLIVKPHHGTATWFPKQMKAMSEVVHLEKSTIDIVTYFPSIDVLVSEASGSLWEFMATGKPSIQMQQGKKHGRVFPGGILEANFETLERVLSKAFNAPIVISDWCERVMGKLDGKATSRAIEFIERVFNE